MTTDPDTVTCPEPVFDERLTPPGTVISAPADGVWRRWLEWNKTDLSWIALAIAGVGAVLVALDL